MSIDGAEAIFIRVYSNDAVTEITYLGMLLFFYPSISTKLFGVVVAMNKTLESLENYEKTP